MKKNNNKGKSVDKEEPFKALKPLKREWAKKRVIRSHTKEVIDERTGELISTENNQTSYVEKEPDYIKMYIDDIVCLSHLPTGMSKILLELIGQMGYNNLIPAYKPMKQLTCRRLGISMSYLNRCIQEFYEQGLFIRVARGVYLANPELFARGRWEDIKQLQLAITYANDEKGNKIRTLKSNLTEQVQLTLGLFDEPTKLS